MNPLLSSIRATARRIVGAPGRRSRPRRAARELRGSGAAGDAVADAIEGAMEGERSPEEEAWIVRIEALRGQLYSSVQPITVIDYGAGSHDQGRSAEEMYAGQRAERRVGEVAHASKPPRWCLLLLRLVRRLEPHSCLEMGTCVGISAAYQAAALELNGAGKLLTLEGAPAVAALARENLAQLGLQHRAEVREGRFQDVLAEAAHVRAPLDLVFVDGHHDGDATIAYFKQLQPHLAQGAVIVFDDIAWSPGMRRAWELIAGDEVVSLAADLGEVGLIRTGG